MNKWEVLSQALQQEGEDIFLLSRITARALEQAHAEGMGVILEEDGHIIACGFLWNTDDSNVLELGTLWVHPSLRGKGLSSQIFARRLALAAAAHKTLFIVSHEPIVAHHTLGSGFTEARAKTWNQHVAMRHTCGPCDRVAEQEKPHCPLRARHTHCRLFVREPW